MILLYHVCFLECVHWSMCNTRIDISRACLGCKHSYLCLYISKSVCRLINSKWNRLPFFIGCKHVMLLIYFRIFQQKKKNNNIYLFLSYFKYVNWILALAIEGSVSGIPVTADSVKKKYLLLKGKDRGVSNVMFFSSVLYFFVLYWSSPSFML